VDARYAKLLLANASDHPALRDLHIWTHVYRVTSKTHALTKVTTEAARSARCSAAGAEPEGSRRKPKEAEGSRRKPKEGVRGPEQQAKERARTNENETENRAAGSGWCLVSRL
jgi:hypothetical protein